MVWEGERPREPLWVPVFPTTGSPSIPPRGSQRPLRIRQRRAMIALAPRTDGPMHTGSLEPLAHDGFAACLHHSRTHKHGPLAKLGIAHALGVVAEVLHFPLQIRLLGGVSGPRPTEGTNDGLHFAIIQFVEARLQPLGLRPTDRAEDEFGRS